MARPLIGITTQSLQAIDGIPADLPPSVIMNERYHRAIAAAGGLPLLIPLLADEPQVLRAIFDRLDGVLLPGGVDIHPSCYGDAPHEKLGRVDESRDRTELLLAQWAIAERKPLLGVCRGVQVINVACGGTLHQDIESDVAGAMKHDCFPHMGFRRDHLAHHVAIAEDSRLRDIIGGGDAEVNSLHHQSIKALGAGLTATAVAPDGIVEAVEMRGRGFLVGVQWHPEALERTDERSRNLFRSFVSAAAATDRGDPA